MSALAAIPRPKYQVMPALTPDEAEWLRNDIALHGVLVPIEVDENGDILDGHHRRAIADDLGVECPTVIRSGLSEAGKLEHVVSLNVVRRQMSAHDRQGVITRLRSEGLSLRAIGRAVGVSEGTVRNDLKQGAQDYAPETSPPTEPESQPEPIAPVPTVRDRVMALHASGMSERAIGAELGISHSKVHNLLNPSPTRRAADTPVEWPKTERFIRDLRTFAATDPRRIAATVPERNRQSTAKRLRSVGTFLGSIALELERSER